MTKRKKGCLITAGIFLAVISYIGFRFGPDTLVFLRGGFLEKVEMRSYTGDDAANLNAMHAALMLYHDSEGQFPLATGWMDAIQGRLKTRDLTDAEAAKKLRRPGAPAGEYGYAMNEAYSGKYVDDVKDRTAPLLYVTEQKSRNAKGDGKSDRAGLAISGEGKLIQP